MADRPQYAVIHVGTGQVGDAWPVVERVAGGWQSGAHHYPDADVFHVHKLRLAHDTVPSDVAEAAARLRSDIREAIDVCYGELGGEADTPQDVAGVERALAHDMARVLDWIAAQRTA